MQGNEWWTRLCLFFILIVVVWTTTNINWASHRYTRIVRTDGNGYYAYLPAIFIYNDLQFNFFDEIAEKYRPSNFSDEYRLTIDSKKVNKYYAGTAVAILPFFAAGHMISLISGQELDGYSYYYLILVSLAALFYLFLGLIFINKTLKLFNITAASRAFTLLLIVFGTNLFYYSVHEPSMSHVYSFGFFALFIYSVKKFGLSLDIKYLLLSAVWLGMIVLIRPVNGIAIASIPFLAGDWNTLINAKKRILRSPLAILIGSLILLAIVGIQLLIYSIQTGNPFVYSYGQEGFNFLKPHFGAFLFSFKKGLFIYTPVLLITLGGLWPMYRNQKFEARSWILFMILVIYVLSSWEQWWYGGSFSSRVMIEYYPFFAILLGILLDWNARSKRPWILISIFILLLLLCQIQTYQYYIGLLHWEEMSWSGYHEIFLKLK